MPKPPTPLSDRQQRFVAAYVRCLNASEAARAAGYSPGVANRNGPRMLSNAVISDAVAKALQAVVAAMEMGAKDIVRELSSIGSSDAKDIFDERGCLLPVHQLSARIRRAIASVKVTQKNLAVADEIIGEVVEIKFWDKNKALDTLSRYRGMLVDRKEVGKPGEFKDLSDAELKARLMEWANKL